MLIKTNCFAWRMLLNLIHVAMNLITRVVNLSSTSCPFCLVVVKDVNHLFFDGHFSMDTWSWFYKGFSFLPLRPSSISDSIPKLKCGGLTKLFRKLKLGYILCYLDDMDSLECSNFQEVKEPH